MDYPWRGNMPDDVASVVPSHGQVRFSIIVPCHNSAGTILGCIDSIRKQTFSSWELIVVDDGSEDKIQSVVNSYRLENPELSITVIRLESNQGPSRARNAGWDASVGEYVAFLDADDFWHPKKLELVNRVLAERGGVDWVGHGFAGDRAKMEAEAIAPREIEVSNIGFWQILLRNPVATPCVVIRRSIGERFNEGFRYLEDHELWLRLARQRPLCWIPLRLAGAGRRPMSPGGLSGSRAKMRLGEIRMYFQAARASRLVLLMLPLLIVFSMTKHVFAQLRARV